MRMNYEAVLFDVDGTLLDTAEGVLASVAYATGKHGLSTLSDAQMRTFIGPPIQNSLERYYDLDQEEIRCITETFREHYKEVALLKAKPYDGIYQVFETLKKNDVKLAVATYKRQDYAIRLLKHFGFDKYTSILYGADNENKLKKKDIMKKCADDLKIYEYSRVVMVGDSDNDAIGAQKLGMKFIGVTYGFDFKSRDDVMKFPAIGHADQTKDITRIILGEGADEN